jgi:hypothetical protein
VLSSRLAEKLSASWSVPHAGAAMILSVVTLAPAYAGSVIDLSCVAGGRNFNCVAQFATAGDPYVRVVPQALDESQKAEVAARDRKWVVHCRPEVRHDSFGVARYHYAAPGCEFGFVAE